MSAIVERRYTVVLPTLETLLEVRFSTWIQCADWLLAKKLSSLRSIDFTPFFQHLIDSK